MKSLMISMVIGAFGAKTAKTLQGPLVEAQSLKNRPPEENSAVEDFFFDIDIC